MTEVKELTAEEKEWFETPVEVQVEPDNIKWLDAMLEMKPDELRSYGVFQYGIPEDVATNAGRQSMVELIITYSLQGRGASASRQRYRYINEIRDVVPPAVTLRTNPLYLTRGEGNAMSVFNSGKLNEKGEKGAWEQIADIRKRIPKTPKPAAEKNDDIEGTAAAVNTTPPQPAGVSLDILMPIIEAGKISRDELEVIAKSLGVTDIADEEKYPTKGDVIAVIKEYHEAVSASGSIDTTESNS